MPWQIPGRPTKHPLLPLRAPRGAQQLSAVLTLISASPQATHQYVPQSPIHDCTNRYQSRCEPAGCLLHWKPQTPKHSPLVERIPAGSTTIQFLDGEPTHRALHTNALASSPPAPQAAFPMGHPPPCVTATRSLQHHMKEVAKQPAPLPPRRGLTPPCHNCAAATASHSARPAPQLPDQQVYRQA